VPLVRGNLTVDANERVAVGVAARSRTSSIARDWLNTSVL
jgi:hypothetical protein